MAAPQGQCPFHSHTNLQACHVVFHNGERFDLCGGCFRQFEKKRKERELLENGHTMSKEEQEEAMWESYVS